jgi:putative transcriptional regulator
MESPLKGKVLIASPSLQDPNFARSVVLIVQHDENGAMGLIINRALETTVGEAWTQVSSVPYSNDDPLFQGGPCEGPLIVLHKDANKGQMEVYDGIFLSSDADAVKSLVDDVADPMKFFVGYAGWSAMQLESELAEGAWQVAEINSNLILSTPGELWEELQKRIKAIGKSMVQTAMRPAVDPKLIPPNPHVN